MLNAVLSVSKHICGRSNRTYHKLQAINYVTAICFAWNYTSTDLYIYPLLTFFSYMEVFESYCILRNGTKFSISENRMITTEILILSHSKQ